MTKYFQKTFALSEESAKDLVHGSIWAAIVNMLLMASSGVIYSFIKDSLEISLNNERPVFNIMFYVAYILVMFMFIIISY